MMNLDPIVEDVLDGDEVIGRLAYYRDVVRAWWVPRFPDQTPEQQKSELLALDYLGPYPSREAATLAIQERQRRPSRVA